MSNQGDLRLACSILQNFAETLSLSGDPDRATRVHALARAAAREVAPTVAREVAPTVAHRLDGPPAPGETWCLVVGPAWPRRG